MSADLPGLDVWLGRLSRRDGDALKAVAELGGRTGATAFEFGCQHPDRPYRERSWWCTAQYAGARLICDGAAGVVQACDGLAQRMLDHGECRGCGKICFVWNADGYRVDEDSGERALRQGVCRWRREGDRWVRECGDAAAADSTREKLAQALIGCEVVAAGQIGAARAGRYDEYLSEHAFPLMLLVMELEQYGEPVAGVVEQVKAGVFDATQAEAQAWAVSQEGQEAFAELTSRSRGLPGGRKKKRGKGRR